MRIAWWVVGAVVIASLVALFAGYASRERALALRRCDDRLSGWAEDRRSILDNWATERLSHAELAAGYPTIAYLLGQPRPGGSVPFPVDQGPVRHARDLLDGVLRIHAHDAAWLVASDLRVVVGAGAAAPVPAAVFECARTVLAGGTPSAAFGPTGAGAPMIAFGAPVRQAAASGGGIVGALVVQDDPARFLYPFLSTEPVRTRTGESLLLGPVGGQVVFLSPQRDGTPALFRTVPSDVPELASLAALEGREAFGEFVDYRRTRVFAATRHLRRTPWALVVKVDQQEALQSSRRGVIVTGLELGALALAVLGLGLGGWRSQRAAYEASLARGSAELAAVLEQALDAILFIARDGAIRHANRRAADIYQYSSEQLLQKRVQDLQAPAVSGDSAPLVQEAAGDERHLAETLHLRRDGTSFPAEVSSQWVSYRGERVILATVRDISERKASEARIVLLNRVLRTLSAVNQLTVRETDRERLFSGACQALVAHGRFRTAEIFLAGADGRLVPAPVAHADDEDGEAASLRVPAEESLADSGPAQAALRGGHTFVVDDTHGDQVFPDWSGVARAHGIRAAAVAPLRSDERALGVLIVQAREPGVFGGEIVELLEELAEDLTFAEQALEAQRLKREAQAALLESESRLAEAQRLGHVGSWMVDLETGQAHWSDENFRIYGEEPGAFEPTWEHFLERVLPEDRPGLTGWKRDLVEGPREFRIVRPDGAVRVVEIEAQTTRGASGLRLGGTTRDVTERRRGEAQLRKLSRAIEQSPVSVVITDAAGAIEYVNPKFSQVSGYTRDEVLGRNPRLLKSGETSEETYRELWATLGAGREWRGELCNRRKNGELFWEEAVISPILDDQGRTTDFIAVKEDISERKRSDATLHEAQAQLQQAQKMEAVGRLAGGVAHDFNNVLGVITGYGEIVRRTLAADDPRRPKLDQVLRAAERAAGLTRQLLAFSRRQVLQPKALDLNSLVIEMEKMLRRLIGEDVELCLALGAQLHTVMADPGQVEQVLMNLAVNARDAMPLGGRLTIATDNVGVEGQALAGAEPIPAGCYARLTVSDSGQGMDTATLARVFEPFFTTKGPDKGTGLGLATVYGIVSQSGGQIRVESSKGVGTTFSIYLPSVDVPAAPEAAVEREHLPALARGAETLLLAEDESMFREMMQETLEACGYTVLVAPDAEGTLARARTHAGPLHLLVTDVIMPRISGRQLAEQITALRPETKVLYVSGYTADVIAPHGVLLPGVAFLHKPFTSGDLSRKVRAVLDGPQPSS